MFEHLDDPAPPSADRLFRRRVAARRASLDRRHRLLVGSAAAASAVALIAVTVGATTAGKSTVKVGTFVPTTVVASPTTVVGPISTTVPTTVAPPQPSALACGALTPAVPAEGLRAGTRRTATATLGSVSAVLSGTAATSFGSPSLAGATLTVVRAGHTLLAAAVGPPQGLAAVLPLSISAASAEPASAPLCVARLAPDAEPTVLLGLYLGGAHCCTVVRAIALSSTGAGPPVDDDLGNPGAATQIESGQAVIVTADTNFDYAFTDYADSGAPVRMLAFEQGGFVDTTRRYPDLIAQDAAKWLQGFVSRPANGLGFLAAWVGDQCLLGQSTAAWAKVGQLQAQGKLNMSPGGPTGAVYVRQLHTFLTQHGYCS